MDPGVAPDYKAESMLGSGQSQRKKQKENETGNRGLRSLQGQSQGQNPAVLTQPRARAPDQTRSPPVVRGSLWMHELGMPASAWECPGSAKIKSSHRGDFAYTCTQCPLVLLSFLQTLLAGLV